MFPVVNVILPLAAINKDIYLYMMGEGSSRLAFHLLPLHRLVWKLH